MRDVFLRSGKWRWSVDGEGTAPGRSLELFEPRAPYNKMSAPLPFSWRDLSNDQVAEIARDPEVRLWTDENGIPWRVARVGPDSHYPYPLQKPHLVFDSENAFAGIVAIDQDAHLGDLSEPELRRYRDRMRDFGGRRRAFRPPSDLSH